MGRLVTLSLGQRECSEERLCSMLSIVQTEKILRGGYIPLSLRSDRACSEGRLGPSISRSD